MSKEQIILIRESLIQSVVSDAVTFGIPAFLAYLNHAFLGNAVVYQVLIFCVFFLSVLARLGNSRQIFKSRKEAIQYLESLSDLG